MFAMIRLLRMENRTMAKILSVLIEMKDCSMSQAVIYAKQNRFNISATVQDKRHSYYRYLIESNI